MRSIFTWKKDWPTLQMLLFSIFICLGPYAYSQSSECRTAPINSCPPKYTGCMDANIHPDITGYPTIGPGDVNCPEPSRIYTDEILENTPCRKKILRVWRAFYDDPLVDDEDLYDECNQVILLEDLPPTINNCPTNISLTVDANCGAVATWTPPTATDACGNVTISSTHNSGDVFPKGITTVVYTFIDACGNQVQCSFEVSVTGNCCNSAPSISCPADYTGCIGDSIEPSNTGTATASSTGSSECSTPTISYSDVVSNGSCAGAKTITRTWKATNNNASAQSTTCVQKITLSDTENPSFTECPNNISATVNANCEAVVTWVAPKAWDNCGVKSIVSTHESGDTFPKGITTVTYTATDHCGNVVSCAFEVTVSGVCCNTAPSITCPPNYTGCIGVSTDPSNTGTATAQSTGQGDCTTPTVTYSDQVSEGSCAGAKTITRTWKATNNNTSGLSATCIQTIILKDTENPTFTECPNNITVTPNANCEAVVTWVAPKAWDNCGVKSIVSTHQIGSTFPRGITTVTYTATDNCGNTAVCSFEVNVTGTCPSDCVTEVTLSCTELDSDHCWDLPEPDTDCNLCAGHNIDGYLYMGELNGHQYYCSNGKKSWDEAQSAAVALGGYLAVINSYDENNYLASKLINQNAWIGLSDEAYEGTFQWVNGDPLNFTHWYSGQPNNYNYAQDHVELMYNGYWNDNYGDKDQEYIVEIPCFTYEIVSGPTSCDELTVGLNEVKYKITDACGNMTTCTVKVTVTEDVSLTCPQDAVLSCPFNNTGIYVNWQTPVLHTCCENCEGGTPVPITGFVYMGSYEGHHYYCTKDKYTWLEANNIVASHGGYLASINSAGENAFLAGQLGIQSAYIGLHDYGHEGSFKWENYDPVTYTNWYPGQPNNYAGYQDFVELLNNGQWNDQYNDKPLECIMEIAPQCNSVVQIAGPPSGSFIPIGTTTITYKGTDGCGNQDICSFDITVVKSYCNSESQSSSYNWISNVSFADMTNTSGNNGGYHYFSNKVANVKPGYIYPVSLTPGFGGSSFDVTWRIYIDYNGDSDFADYGELVAKGTGSGKLSGHIPISQNCITGKTRMRVVMTKATYSASYCGGYYYGETEDYDLNILPPHAKEDNGSLAKRLASPETVILQPSTFVLKEYDGKAESIILNQPQLEDINTELKLYPNPAENVLHIETNLPTASKIEIISAEGQSIKKIKVTGEVEPIDVSELPPGVYMMIMYDEAGKKTVRKFTKN